MAILIEEQDSSLGGKKLARAVPGPWLDEIRAGWEESGH
jgi:hypothetical protein